MPELYVGEARKHTSERLDQLRDDLASANALTDGKACVYATGSFGRLEAGEHSDLDVVIIVDVGEDDKGRKKLLLDGIGEIKLKFALIQAVEERGIPKFDAGGKYLESHAIDGFTEWLGSREDDYRNTLTARMLMLLESKWLVGEAVYNRAIDQVVAKYFRDFANHQDEFLPAFLLNDIMRMWRTFCVNYEFSRTGLDSREKIKNVKLKFSRMLTCYSVVVYLLALYAKNKTVAPGDVRSMVAISPTERLEVVAQKSFWGSSDVVQGLKEVVYEALSSYSDFLELTHKPIKKAVQTYTADEAAWREKSYGFGESLSKLIDLLGRISPEGARLRRLIVI